LLYTYRAKLNLWRYLDIGAPALLIGQAIGRWGNFVNQELYGPPTMLPWGIPIDEYHRIPPFNDLSQYPSPRAFTPISCTNRCGTGRFWLDADTGRKFSNRLKEGDLFLIYLIWYPLGECGSSRCAPMPGRLAVSRRRRLCLRS